MELKRAKPVDVICQHSKDGSIIPLRVRVVDDDGQHQTYSIKQFRDCSHNGTRTMPDGVYVTDDTMVFECVIFVFERRKVIRLYCDDGKVWNMSL